MKVKAKQVLAHVSRCAALAALAIVIIISYQAGVDLVFAVLRGIGAFLIVHWVLSAMADIVQVAAFDGGKRPKVESMSGAQSASEPPSESQPDSQQRSRRGDQ